MLGALVGRRVGRVMYHTLRALGALDVLIYSESCSYKIKSTNHIPPQTPRDNILVFLNSRYAESQSHYTENLLV